MVKLCRNPLKILSVSFLSESDFKKLCGFWLPLDSPQRHLSINDIPSPACSAEPTLSDLLLGKGKRKREKREKVKGKKKEKRKKIKKRKTKQNKKPKQDFIGDDLPSVLDGANPRIEGNLDNTGAERQSSARVSSVTQDNDAWLETWMVTSPSQSS